MKCATCGGPISPARLESHPNTLTCSRACSRAKTQAYRTAWMRKARKARK